MLGIALLTLVVAGRAAPHAREQTTQPLEAGQQTAAGPPEQLIIGGTVQRVLGSGIFTIDDRRAAGGQLMILAPGAEGTPVPGATVIARGLFRRFDLEELEKIYGWNEIDGRIREEFATRPILLAKSLATAPGRSLMSAPPARASSPALPRSLVGTARSTAVRLHPAGLAELIEEVGGRAVVIPRAHVLAVINPRAVLIESASSLAPTIGNLDRVLVLIRDAALGVDATLLVGSNVQISGTARTLLGIQVTREVPWPTELTSEMVKRLEIRAAVLAESVHTADGVELTVRQSPP
jgi:hypothetical protein